MKPYGLPRFPEIECPDVSDIQRFALKSSVGRLPATEYKNYIRKAQNRTATRRYFKKQARRLSKQQIGIDIIEYYS